MATEQIASEIIIDAPLDVVWRTITEPDQISQWFADRVELDARPGGRGTFVFDNETRERVHTAPLIVETVEAPTRFAFRWNHPEGAEPTAANSLLVEFTLSAEGAERTRLRVTESGLEEISWAEDAKLSYAREHNEGWAHFLARLAGLYTAGLTGLVSGPASGSSAG